MSLHTSYCLILQFYCEMKMSSVSVKTIIKMEQTISLFGTQALG